MDLKGCACELEEGGMELALGVVRGGVLGWIWSSTVHALWFV